MRILVVSINAWDDTNSLGNTVSNFFGGWKDAEFLSLYFRGSAPSNSVCKKYFKISEKMMLKSIFSPKSCGEYFEMDASVTKKPQSLKEKRFIAFLHRYKVPFVHRLFDFLWDIKSWQNEKLAKVIKEFNPDIVFSFAKADSQYYQSIKYIKENTNAKLVLFSADDVYSMYKAKNNRYFKKLKNRFTKLMEIADKVYAISPSMCEFYGSEFGRKFELLQKGCDKFSNVKPEPGNPIKLVYAGNFYYGRLDILCKIAQSLEKCAGNTPVSFEIYSANELSDGELARLENSCTKFMGARPYSQIEKILAESDIVLHAESFDESQIQEVKYSFSTKIIDCLKSGSVLLVVGPSGIASVECTKKIPGAFVIDDVEKIESGIEKLVSQKDTLAAKAAETQKYAMENHHIDRIRNRIYEDFAGLLEL